MMLAIKKFCLITSVHTFLHILMYTLYLIHPDFLHFPTTNSTEPSSICEHHGGFTQTTCVMWPAYTAGKIQFSMLRFLEGKVYKFCTMQLFYEIIDTIKYEPKDFNMW